MLNRKLLLAATVGASLAAPVAAFAQTTSATPATNEVEELVITGTRLPGSALDSASPVRVLRPDSAALEGLFDAAQILQLSPTAAGSTQQTSLVTGAIENGGPGVSTVSLRGLGDQRTLVLMNGRRLAPAGVGGQVGAVDLNVLPSAAVDRYEILKDGASSIYGSDAVAGVVNVITRDRLDGGVLTADGTSSEDGGGDEYRLSGAFGRVLDTSRFQVSAEWYRRDKLTLADRPWLDCAQGYVFDPDTGERVDRLDYHTGEAKCVSTTGNTAGYMQVYEVFATSPFAQPGAAPYGANPYYVPIAVAGPRGAPPVGLSALRPIPIDEQNYNVEVENDTTVITPAERITVFANGAFDLLGAEAYGELLVSHRESEQKSWQTIFQPIAPLNSLGQFAPCTVNPLVYGCTGGSTIAPFSVWSLTTPMNYHVGFAPWAYFLTPNESEQTVDVKRVVLGVRGDLKQMPGWKWDAYLSASQSRGEYLRTGINAERLAGIAGVDRNGVPGPSCWGSGCTLLNFFTDEVLTTGTVPQSYLDYLQIRETGKTEYTQVMGEAYAAGSLMQLPAGPLGVVVGASFRRDEIDDRPGAEAVAGNYWGRATAGPTKGHDSVYELFGEAAVPLLRDAPFAREVTLNLSGRYSNYDSYGSNGTYKAGLSWRVTEDVRVRATYGTSFRAPTLYEMFLNDQTAFLQSALVDPCVAWFRNANTAVQQNCATAGVPSNFNGGTGVAQLTIGGGEDLEPEESTSRSIGVVWTPSSLGLVVAVDYWEVDIDDEVASLGSAVVGQCYASVDFPNDPSCGLFTRDANPASPSYRSIVAVDASYRNIVSQTARGVDLDGGYSHRLGPGRLNLTAQVSWTLEDKQELFAGRTDDFNGVIGQPELVASSAVSYDMGPWTATWSRDFVGEQSNYDYQFGARCGVGVGTVAGPVSGTPYCAKNHAEAVWYNHVSVRYQADGWSLTGGVRNLADEKPPFVSEALGPDMGEATYRRVGNTPGTSQYDMVGRRFFVSLSKKF